MDGKIIAFRVLKGTNQRVTNQFCKKFYGQGTSSHGGKYRYRRRGLLDDIPHRKLIRGVIIVRNEDADRVIEFLEAFNAEFYVRDVMLTQDDELYIRE